MLLAAAIAGFCSVPVAGQSRDAEPRRLAHPAPAAPRGVSILPLLAIGPRLTLAMAGREAWQRLPDPLRFGPSPQSTSTEHEDRDQFAGVRALRLDRGRRTRGVDARLEFRLSGDLGGVTSDLGLGGLPRLVQRAFTR
ncbi:MAG: hypothetical protein V4537_10205 [Pseudomonadota bacterium]